MCDLFWLTFKILYKLVSAHQSNLIFYSCPTQIQSYKQTRFPYSNSQGNICSLDSEILSNTDGTSSEVQILFFSLSFLVYLSFRKLLKSSHFMRLSLTVIHSNFSNLYTSLRKQNGTKFMCVPPESGCVHWSLFLSLAI